MIRLEIFEKLPTGGKVYLGFAFTTLLFAIVIWLFYTTLFQALSDHERLLAIQERTKSSLLHIHQYLLDARRSEKDFLVKREERFIKRTHDQLDKILSETKALDRMSPEDGTRQMAARGIGERAIDYRNAFDQVVVAWRAKGLSHELGLQGRFRDTIHMVEEKARDFNVGSLHRMLLEIRRAEKDTGLRQRSEYMDRTLQLTDAFIAAVSDSALERGVQVQLVVAIQSYRRHYVAFADGILSGAPLNGGMGAFRDAAHVVENILVSHFMPDFEKNILLLRRWEKDYLLRNEKQYVTRFLEVLGTIRTDIAVSGIPDTKKEGFTTLLAKYEKDFLALVAQNKRIADLQTRMESDVEEIESLIERNVRNAVVNMSSASEETHRYSVQRAKLALAIGLAALVLALVFAEFITRRIARPLSTLMALTGIFSAGSVTQGDVEDRDETKTLARALGSMSGNIFSLSAEIEQTERELEGIAGELTEISALLGNDGNAQHGLVAINRLNVTTERTTEIILRLRETVGTLDTDGR